MYRKHACAFLFVLLLVFNKHVMLYVSVVRLLSCLTVLSMYKAILDGAAFVTAPNVFALLRQKDLRPASGLVYEDVAADLTAQPAIEAAQAATPPSAPSAANTASRQLPATASSSRSKRTRRQTDFYHNIYAASPGAESSDDSNDSNYSAAHSKRKQQRNVRQTRSSSSKYGQRTRAAGELRPTFSNECTDSIPEHPVLSADSQGASASRHPASASQQAASRQAVQDWPDDASSDGGRKQAVCDSSNNCVVPSPVIRHVTAEQAVFGDSSQDDQPAAPCGSLSTAYDTDGDSDGDDVPAFAAPLPLLPRPTSTGCNQQKPKTEIRRSHKQLRGTAEPAVLPPSTEAAAAAAVAPVKVPLALGSATLLDVAEPANLVRRPGQPSGNSLTSASQRVFSASTPPPRTVEELVAAANANMGDSKDAITLVQMRVFSRLEHLLDLEKDEEHDPLDELQDSAELTSYQARKIRKHYLRIEQLHK